MSPACWDSPLPAPGTQDPVARQRGRAARSPWETSRRAIPRKALHCCCTHPAPAGTPALPATCAHPRDPPGCRQTVSEVSASPGPTCWGPSSPYCLCSVFPRAPVAKGTALALGLNLVKIHCQNEAVYQYHVTFRYRRGHGGPGPPAAPRRVGAPWQSPPCLSVPPSIPVAARWSVRRSHGAADRAAAGQQSKRAPGFSSSWGCWGPEWSLVEGQSGG